jgi:hypothetical protein
MDIENIKPYSEVEVGDEAFSVETNEYEGIITWKGFASDLPEEDLSDWLDCLTMEEIENLFDLVKVECGEEILFNYNNDPCGVIVYKS